MAMRKEQLYAMQEYLELERQVDIKSEFYNGQIYAMSGASTKHNIIATNIIGELYQKLKGQSCQAFGSDMRLKASEHMAAYPDVMIVCGKLETVEDKYKDTILNPMVIMEILSPTTEQYDRGVKFAHYRKNESLQEYLLISQNQPCVERYRRVNNGDWMYCAITGLDAKVILESVGVTLNLADVYDRIDFSIDEEVVVAPPTE